MAGQCYLNQWTPRAEGTWGPLGVRGVLTPRYWRKKRTKTPFCPFLKLTSGCWATHQLWWDLRRAAAAAGRRCGGKEAASTAKGRQRKWAQSRNNDRKEVEFGKAQSNLFLMLNRDRSTLQKNSRPPSVSVSSILNQSEACTLCIYNYTKCHILEGNVECFLEGVLIIFALCNFQAHDKILCNMFYLTKKIYTQQNLQKHCTKCGGSTSSLTTRPWHSQEPHRQQARRCV